MADTSVSYVNEGMIGVITIDRPPANSYEINTMRHLAGAVDAAANDDGARVVLLRSALDKFFCAGADLKAFQANSSQENREMVTYAHQVLARIASLPKVFIAVINGHALGGGLEIALACDLRFAGDGSYQLGLPEVTLAMLPGNGGTQRLPRLIGKAKAFRMMITGQTVGPHEALSLGIVDQVFPAQSLWDETLAFAHKLAGGAPLAIGNIKRAVNQGLEMSLAEGLELEIELAAELFDTEDAAEGTSAFVQKRKPEFKGR